MLQRIITIQIFYSNYVFFRFLLKSVGSHLKTLLCQGAPIRGNTDLESNIYQFHLDKARGGKGLKLLLDEKHYVTVHDVLMEQEQVLVLNAQRHLMNSILSKAFYSILSDESSNVSKKEQLSFSVRICNENYEVSEDFVGIYECSHYKGFHPMHSEMRHEW